MRTKAKKKQQSHHISKENEYMLSLMKQYDLQPIDTSDPEQVWQRCIEYLVFCCNFNAIPQVTGLALWLGISRDTLHSWRRGEYRRETHQEIAEKMYAIIEEVFIDRFMNDCMPPAVGIFLAKNWFNYSDRVDYAFESKPNPFADLNSEEAMKRLQEKYLLSIPDDQEEGD